MSDFIPITVAYGDGIGPEITEATIKILKQAEAPIRIESIEVGEKLYQKGYTSGISESTWESISRTKVLLKGPITTPQGGGYKSLNVTIRKSLGLYANIRPVASYYPFVKTKHPVMDMVIVRENEEDLYAGIEYRHTANMYKSLKLISSTGSEKIIRYAFDFALKNNRKKISCISKDNIMKFTDGIFHKIFDKVAEEYKKDYGNLITDHYIVDIGAAKIANSPEDFDVIVTSNLYGDIISDIASECSGSVGLSGSGNIGNNYAMFEAIHGSAPTMAGKNSANPSGLINAAVMMLVHLGLNEHAEKIENALKKTIEDGVHTKDIYDDDKSSKKASTSEFADAVIKRLGSKPEILKPAKYVYSDKDVEAQSNNKSSDSVVIIDIPIAEKRLVGMDIFIDLKTSDVDEVLAEIIKITEKNTENNLELYTISTKGLKLWPYYKKINVLSDHWCLRFKLKNDIKNNNGDNLQKSIFVDLLKDFSENGIDFVSTECLYEFDGNEGFSLSQNE